MKAVPDLFVTTNEPKELAINQALSQAVEEWIADEMDNAAHMVGMAEEFMHADDDLFEPTY